MKLPKIPSLLDVELKDCPPMSKQQSEMLIKLTMLEMELREKGDDEQYEFREHQAKEMGFPGQVMQKRLEYFKIPVTFPCAAFVLLSCKSPGDVVMWCYTFNRIFNKTRRIVDLQELCTRFPNGFPTEEAMDKTWDAQKGYNHVDGNGEKLKVDNIIDQPEPWELDPDV